MNTKILKRSAKQLTIVGTLAGSFFVTHSAVADTIISTFENFNLDGLFPSWNSATVVSLPTGYSITASG